MTVERCPDYEGRPVQVADLKVTGVAAADRPIEIGETLLLSVEVECTQVLHKETDAGLKRTHTLKVVEVTEPLDDIAGRMLDQLRQAADHREGRQALPLDGGTVDPETGEILDDGPEAA